MSAQGFEQFAIGTPQPNGAVFTGGGDALTVWTHGDSPDRSLVSLKGFEQLAESTPQINVAVHAGCHQALAVGTKTRA